MARSGLIFLFFLLFGAIPCAGQVETGVSVSVQTVPLQTLRLSDFDPTRPEASPLVLTITVFNDDQARDLIVRVLVTAEQFGFLGTTTKRLGRVAPMAVVTFQNREFDDYDIEDAAADLMDIALPRGVLPADTYRFDVQVFDRGIQQGTVLIAEDEGFIDTSNPGHQLDLLGPGTPFGQDPDVVTGHFPIFQWITDASLFDFALYDVRPGQRAPEDVVTARPVFSANNIQTSTFPYPSYAEVLVPGRTYAWQIEALVQTSTGIERLPSEVFWFTIVQGETENGTTDPTAAPFSGGTATRLVVTPQEIEVQPGGVLQFSAEAFNEQDLPLLAIRPTWRLTPASAGTIDETGRFEAGGSPGVVAVTARVGAAEDYATVFIRPLDSSARPTVALADSASADTTLEITVLSPSDTIELMEPSVDFSWQVTGTDSLSALRFRVSTWHTGGAIAEAVPDAAPLWQRTVQGSTTLTYPAGVPSLEPSQFYIGRIDAFDANGQLLGQSAPFRFWASPQDKLASDLQQAWADALQQNQANALATLVIEIRTPTLTPADRQSLLGTGALIEVEDGPWLQLQLPFAQLGNLVQLGFLRSINLPAPPLLSTAPSSPPSFAPEPPVYPADTGSERAAPVRVAVLEFGFDEAAVRSLLGDRIGQFNTFRRDGDGSGGSPQVAAHGAVTVQALTEYLPPDAEVHLLNFDTELNFRQALRYAVGTLGVRVLTCSVSWMDAYDDYDGTAYLFTLDDILGDRAVLTAAAGNFAQSHWEGAFADANGNQFHAFSPGQDFLDVQLKSNVAYTFLLSWDDWEQPTIDLDLSLLDASGAPLADAAGKPVRSTNRQGLNQFEKPMERIRSFTPFLPGTQTYRLQIEALKLKGGDAPPPHLELYMYPAPERSTPDAEPASSLAAGLATARTPGVVPVAATGFARSSQGPSNDLRVRPDFASNGVVQWSTTRYEGTSFATPRLAGAYTLVFSQHPDWSTQQATDFLQRFTASGGVDSPKDTRFGWGALDFNALLKALSL